MVNLIKKNKKNWAYVYLPISLTFKPLISFLGQPKYTVASSIILLCLTLHNFTCQQFKNTI